MSTQTDNIGLTKPDLGETGWDVTLNANADLLDAYIGPLGVRPAEVPSTSLNVAVAAGAYQKQDETVASFDGNPSCTVDANSTTMLWLTEDGTLSSGSDWPTAGTFHVRLAVIVSDDTTITGVTPWTKIPRSVSS
jgi:hypothetical protein